MQLSPNIKGAVNCCQVFACRTSQVQNITGAENPIEEFSFGDAIFQWIQPWIEEDDNGTQKKIPPAQGYCIAPHDSNNPALYFTPPAYDDSFFFPTILAGIGRAN